jgi:hypothetical protein
LGRHEAFALMVFEVGGRQLVFEVCSRLVADSWCSRLVADSWCSRLVADSWCSRLVARDARVFVARLRRLSGIKRRTNHDFI